MELKIKQVTIPEVVEFNYDELKGWLEEKASYYASLIYTDENIADAKKDRAEINKFVKALEDARKAKKKEFLKPYEEFEAKIKQLEAVIQEPMQTIDAKVGEYEEKRKKEKLAQIGEIWDAIEDKPAFLKCNDIWDKRWLNATMNLKTVAEEMSEKVRQIVTKVKWIEQMEFGEYALKIYERTLDLDKAMAEGKEAYEVERQKEERRKEAEAETEAIHEADRQEQPAVTEPQKVGTGSGVAGTEKIYHVVFESDMTMPQAKKLKAFCDAEGIPLRSVK